LSNQDVNLYINFVLHAIYGKLGEADTIMRFAGDSIRRIADEIAAECPIKPLPLYRGMLLEPDVPYAADPKLTFLSWSEDQDVALWFACPRSAVSEPLAKLKPTLRGYVSTMAAPRARVLFHHSWVSALGGLACFALIHPLMGAEGKRQIEWSLRTQREVITEPIADLHPRSVPDLDAATLEALERRLSPPWIIEEEGIRS
jgi:hypothetical protein